MNLGDLVAGLGIDTRGIWEAEKVMNEFAAKTDRQMKSLQVQLDKVGDKFMKAGRTASAYLTAPILVASGMAFKMASDYNESLNKIEVAFKSSSKTVGDWSKNTIDKFGIASGTALDRAALFGDMATSMGFTTNKAASMSTSLVGLAADLASFKNIQIDVAQTALAGVFTGETESLKRLGIVMTETNLQEYAYSQNINKRIDKMSQAEKVMLRYNYVLNVTKNAQGDFERTGGGAANQLRMMMENLKQTAQVFGQLLIPQITKAMQWLNDFAKRIQALDENQKTWIIRIGLTVAAIGPFLLIVGGAIKTIALLTTGVTLAARAVQFLSAAIASNPWGLLITALAAAGVMIYQYYQKVGVSAEYQAKLNAELEKTERLQNRVNDISKTSGDIGSMDPTQLSAYKAQVKATQMDIVRIKQMSIDEFVKQDETYMKLKASYDAETNMDTKRKWGDRLATVTAGLNAELSREKLTADEKLKVIGTVLTSIGEKEKQFGKQVLSQVTMEEMMKRVENTTKAWLEFSNTQDLISLKTKVLGTEFDANSERLNAYNNLLETLKNTGNITAKEVENLTNRIFGLTSAMKMVEGIKPISFTKTFKPFGKDETSYRSVNNGNIIGANYEQLAGQIPLENIQHYFEQAAIAQQKLIQQQEATKASTIDMGSIFSNVFQGMSNSIQNALDSTSNILEAFGKFFADFIKGMIIKLVAATVAAFTLALVLSALGIGGGKVFKALGEGASFGKTFGAGFKAFTGMANGGVVPPGFPNDTYPAMLTSGEAVVPPKALATIGQNSGNGKRVIILRLAGRDAEAVIEEQDLLKNTF